MDRAFPLRPLLNRLKKHYPNPAVGLDFKTPWQLLVATILAAQCTDKKINQITPVLFKKYPEPNDLAKALTEDVEIIVRQSGFFRAKAKNIMATAKDVAERFNGSVPQTLEELITFPGVARKTANVIMSYAFLRPAGIVVDTHVLRVCYRLGLTRAKLADEVERDLMRIVPKTNWGPFPNQIKLLGQEICKAPLPLCEKCFLNNLCPKR
jgi:endonuclease III